MYVLALLLLSRMGRGQVSQGCFQLQSQPSIVLTSDSMDPPLCYQSCSSSPYVLIAPTLSNEYKFWCSCAKSIPSITSSACNMPCPGADNPSTAPICGGYYSSRQYVAWSVYSTGIPLPPLVSQNQQQSSVSTLIEPSSVMQNPASAIQVETANGGPAQHNSDIASSLASSGTSTTEGMATMNIKTGINTATTSSEIAASTMATKSVLAAQSNFVSPSLVQPSTLATKSVANASTGGPSMEESPASSTSISLVVALVLSVVLFFVLLAAFVWLYLQRRVDVKLNSRRQEIEQFTDEVDQDSIKYRAIYVPYTGPIVPNMVPQSV